MRQFLSFLLLGVILLPPASGKAQEIISGDLPDSITVQDNTWNLVRSTGYNYTLVREDNAYGLYQNLSSFSQGRHVSLSTERTFLYEVSNQAVQQLIDALKDTSYPSLKLSNLGIDSTWLHHHVDRLFGYVKKEYDYWTDAQIKATKKELTDISNYDALLGRALLQEGVVFIVKDYSINFNIHLYSPGQREDSLQASENTLGFPWAIDGRKSFNPQIPKQICAILPSHKYGNMRRFSDYAGISSSLAVEIYHVKCEPKVHELAIADCNRDLEKLKSDFEVIYTEESYLDWLEFKDHPQTFRVTLKSPTVHSGIQLIYYVTKSGNSLYPADSLIQRFPSIRDRIQHIKFLMDFLDENPARKINVFFFDNHAISLSHIEDFNKNPKKWAEHDQWVKWMDMYKDGKIKPDFDIAESIETSKQVSCGCNLRMDNTLLLQSILFEVRDELNNSSTWILLPDNTPVLWYFQATSFGKYTYHDLGTDGRGVQYPCRKFAADGNLLP